MDRLKHQQQPPPGARDAIECRGPDQRRQVVGEEYADPDWQLRNDRKRSRVLRDKERFRKEMYNESERHSSSPQQHEHRSHRNLSEEPGTYSYKVDNRFEPQLKMIKQIKGYECSYDLLD